MNSPYHILDLHLLPVVLSRYPSAPPQLQSMSIIYIHVNNSAKQPNFNPDLSRTSA